MKKDLLNERFTTYHFLGVGGVSMSALAKYMIAKGKTVSGSDIADSPSISELRSLGAKVGIGKNVFNPPFPDVAVYSSAIRESNREFIALKNSRALLAKRSQLLGEIMSTYSTSIGISGSHGKTTATAMLSDALVLASLSPTVFLGGENKKFGNFLLGSGEVCLAEVCEYKKNMLDISPKIAVVLNIDNDHLDSYRDMDDMTECFSEYVGGGIALINADDGGCCKISHSATVTFGINNKSTYSASGIREEGGKYAFTARAYGRKLGRIKLSVFGKHNIYNALVTVAVCDMLKIPFFYAKRALENFKGVGRRMEEAGSVNGCKIICDYAHHPSEIRATVSSVKGDRAFTVFQPHTYSRTERLMEEFILALKGEKNLVIYKTYPARENYSESGDGKTLYENIVFSGKTNCYYADTPEKLGEYLERFAKKDTNGLVLGAGDIYAIVKNILEK